MSSLPYRGRRAHAVRRPLGVVEVALWFGAALLMAPACRADFDRFDFGAAAGGAAQGARGGSAGASAASGGARAGAAGDAGDNGMGGTPTTAGASAAGSGGLVAGSGGAASDGGADTAAGAGGAAGNVSSIGRVECPPGSGVQCGLEEFCCGAQPSGAPVCLPVGEACAPQASLYCDELGDCAGASEVCCVSNSTGVTHSECVVEGDCSYPDNRVWCDGSAPANSVECGVGWSCVASSIDVLGLSFSGAMLATCEPVGGAASGAGGASGSGMGGITGTSSGGTTGMGGTTGTGFGGTTGTGATGGI